MNIINKIDTFLNESKIETFEEFTELVKRDCSEFLKEIKSSKAFLYRGIKGVSDDMGIKTPRADRKPKDTSAKGHKYLGDLFKKHHGWNPRKEGVFCFADEFSTHYYGKSYIIFPINGYKYLWSSNISDLYAETSSDYSFNYEQVYGNLNILWDDGELEEFMDEMMGNYEDEDEDDDEDDWPNRDELESDVLDAARIELNLLIKDYNKSNLSILLNGTQYNKHEVSLKCKKYYYIVYSGKIDDDLALSIFN